MFDVPARNFLYDVMYAKSARIKVEFGVLVLDAARLDLQQPVLRLLRRPRRGRTLAAHAHVGLRRLVHLGRAVPVHPLAGASLPRRAQRVAARSNPAPTRQHTFLYRTRGASGGSKS